MPVSKRPHRTARYPHSWKYHTGAAPAPLRWLIKGILPETGAALMAGQWGTFKTTVALDVSVCVMAQLPFAGRYRVKRRGAVLYIALEGESMLAARLAAIAAHRGVSGPLPFAWRGDCPALTNKNATAELCAIADEAAADLDRNFGLPVVLIWIDTVITAAGYNEGGDNDTAASQKVMSALRILSKHTGALGSWHRSFRQSRRNRHPRLVCQGRCCRYGDRPAGGPGTERRRQEHPACRAQATRRRVRV